MRHPAHPPRIFGAAIGPRVDPQADAGWSWLRAHAPPAARACQPESAPDADEPACDSVDSSSEGAGSGGGARRRQR
eukprot:13683639-Alexandrium_andersonii.AAC.1